MKAKISLGSGGIKGLILKHVEKAVAVLAVLLFGMLVWSASKLGGDFDLQPDQLQSTSADADKAIREPKKGPPAEVPPWKEIAQGIKKPVPADPYGVDKTWMHRLFPGETLRGEPSVFAAEKLRASTGFGGISVSASGALTRGAGGAPGYEMDMGSDMEYGGSGSYGGNTEGRRWVVVTGLLPYKKQWVEYGNVFRNAEVKFPQRDVPSYIYYEVERAEVTLGKDPDEDDWKQLKIFKEFENRKWAGGKPEIIYPKFLHRSASIIPMAYPLPPLVNKEFGVEIAHEPEIPLYYEVERKVEEEEIDWDSLTPEELIEARKKFGQLGGRGAGYGMSGGEGGYEDYQQDYGGYGGMEEMSGYGDMTGYGGEAGYSGMATRQREIPEYQLFRFFDFTVLPGRYYQYRVRLRLTNPNYELPPQNLEDETSSEYATLETEWSDPTKVVMVSLDSRVLAGPVSVSSNVNVAPKGDLGAVYFSKEDGDEVAEKVTVARGQLLNLFDIEIEEEKPATGIYGASEDYMSGMSSEDPYGGMYGEAPRKKKERRKRQPEEPAETVDFVTEMLVLDFLGGAIFPGTDRNMKEPGRILMMDRVGNLVLQEELADQEEFLEFFPPEVKKKPEAESPYGDEYGEYMMESSGI